MPVRKLLPLTGGHNSKRDPGMVGSSQLIYSQGAEYKLGDPEIIHKIQGRSLYGTVGAVQRVQGLVLATYDDATTFLLAVGGQNLYYSDASNGFTGTFTAGTLPSGGGRSAATEYVSAAHFNNRWFVATGKDSNLVVEADATIVNHGMYAPAGTRNTVTTVPVGAEDSFLTYSTASGTWNNVNGVADVGATGDIATSPFALLRMTSTDEDTPFSITYAVTITNTFNNKVVELQYLLQDDEKLWFGNKPGDDSIWMDDEREWAATLTISYATDGGTTFTSSIVENYRRNLPGIENFQIPIPDGTATEDIRIKFELLPTTLSGLTELAFRIYQLKLTDGSTLTTITSSGSLFYACTEYDAKRNWESALSDVSEVPAGSTFSAVKYFLPTANRSANATHYKIYRTSDNNSSLVESELGLIGKVAVGTEFFLDTFRVWGVTEIPTSPLYEFLILDEFGVKSYYDINTPPPPMTFIGNFKGSMFGLSNRQYVQSMAGRPNQWPKLFAIERMPFKENSELIAGHQIGDSLWIGSRAGVILLDHPIETRQGSLRLPAPRRLEGAPGLVGPYAATPLSFDGESLVAWVTNHGLYISNLATFEKVSDDIDWENTVTESSLEEAVLFWREKTQQLVLIYDSTGDGDNDAYMLFHMGDQQKSPTGRPLVTVGHSGKFAHWTGGRIGGVWKEFSCHASSNGVYLEGGSATADASNSYNTASDIPFDVGNGRHYFGEAVDVGRAQLFHSGVSTTMTLSVSYGTGREEDTNDRTEELLLAMSSTRSKWADLHVGNAGDFSQWRFRHTGQVKFSLGPIAPMVEGDDEQGPKL